MLLQLKTFIIETQRNKQTKQCSMPYFFFCGVHEFVHPRFCDLDTSQN